MQLRLKIIFIFFVFCCGFTAMVFAENFAAFTGQVNSAGVNLRVDSTTGSEVICNLSKGELVEVVREAYDWYKIRLPKQAPSYIRKDLLECNSAANPEFASPSSKCSSAKVIKDKVNIRLAPSESAWILGKVEKGTVVTVIGDDGSWFKIHPVYQSYGWINKKFVNKEVVALKPDTAAITPAAVNSDGQIVVEGTVAPYGVVLWRKATHKLVTADNQVYFLKGQRKSLDNLNYRKVKVTGKLITSGQARYPIIQTDIIEAIN
jgi:uncharacterized protein YgiM (DUF1202 family)